MHNTHTHTHTTFYLLSRQQIHSANGDEWSDVCTATIFFPRCRSRYWCGTGTGTGRVYEGGCGGGGGVRDEWAERERERSPPHRYRLTAPHGGAEAVCYNCVCSRGDASRERVVSPQCWTILLLLLYIYIYIFYIIIIIFLLLILFFRISIIIIITFCIFCIILLILSSLLLLLLLLSLLLLYQHSTHQIGISIVRLYKGENCCCT